MCPCYEGWAIALLHFHVGSEFIQIGRATVQNNQKERNCEPTRKKNSANSRNPKIRRLRSESGASRTTSRHGLTVRRGGAGVGRGLEGRISDSE